MCKNKQGQICENLAHRKITFAKPSDAVPTAHSTFLFETSYFLVFRLIMASSLKSRWSNAGWQGRICREVQAGGKIHKKRSAHSRWITATKAAVLRAHHHEWLSFSEQPCFFQAAIETLCGKSTLRRHLCPLCLSIICAANYLLSPKGLLCCANQMSSSWKNDKQRRFHFLAHVQTHRSKSNHRWSCRRVCMCGSCSILGHFRLG